MNIIPYEPPMRQAALDLALRAWSSVFPQLKAAVPGFVYGAFYPEEWQKRQLSDLGQILDNEPHTVDVAMLQGQNGSETSQLAGWVCTRIHPEDSMGEVYILAVDPQFQRHSHDRARAAGMTMMMVETGGDPGHAPARHTYEAAGYQRWPVARYFKNLQ